MVSNNRKKRPCWLGMVFVTPESRSGLPRSPGVDPGRDRRIIFRTSFPDQPSRVIADRRSDRFSRRSTAARAYTDLPDAETIGRWNHWARVENPLDQARAALNITPLQ